MKRKTDWAKAASLPPEELDRLLEDDADEVDDGAEATDAEIAAAQPGKRRPGQRGPGKRPAKVLMTVRVEPETLEAYRSTGEGWQKLVGEVLRAGAPGLASRTLSQKVSGQAGKTTSSRKAALTGSALSQSAAPARSRKTKAAS